MSPGAAPHARPENGRWLVVAGGGEAHGGGMDLRIFEDQGALDQQVGGVGFGWKKEVDGSGRLLVDVSSW